MSPTPEPAAEIQIRPARPEDAGPFLQLVDALAAYERLSPPDAEAKVRLIDHLFRDRPTYRLLVAEREERVVGYAAHCLSYSTFLARPTLFLEDIFVLPEERRHGIGRKLFLYVAKTAVAEGCGRMETFVLDRNEVALSFFAREHLALRQEWLLHRVEGEALRRLAAQEV